MAAYYFTQSGWTGGGVVFGHFDAVDLNGDGWIVAISGDGLTLQLVCEVTDFSMSFTGNSLVPPFSIQGLQALNAPDSADLDTRNGIVYQIGSPSIPFGQLGADDGIHTWLVNYYQPNWCTASTEYPCGSLGALVTYEPVLVSQVPEPGVGVLLTALLALLLTRLSTWRRSA